MGTHHRLRATLERHVPALDGLRGLAVLLVIAHNSYPNGPSKGLVTRLFESALGVGWVGVQLFFVLSGFLITGILVDTRRAANYFRSFYARRVLRIFPLYYAALFAYFVVLPRLVALPEPLTRQWGNQIWYWTYLSNWTDPLGSSVRGLTHFWSLAVEEQFYLLWPLVVFALSARALGRLCVGLAIAGLAARAGVHLAGLDPAFAYAFTVCRMDALAIGALTALLVRSPQHLALVAPRLRLGVGALVAALLGVAGLAHGFMRHQVLVQTVGYTLFALLAAAVILIAVLQTAEGPGRLLRALSLAPLRSIGKYSYAMYVVHLPLHIYVASRVEPRVADIDGWRRAALLSVYITAMIAASYLLAVASWHLVEKHFLRLKRLYRAEPRAAAA